MKAFVFCQKLEPNPIRKIFVPDLEPQLCGGDPPATARSQLTHHALHMAEFEAELPRGGWFTWQPHGVPCAFLCVIAEPHPLYFR
jgi:hypothetical protein